MQPYLYPYIGYFQLINAVDKFIIYDDVNYIKKGWINRNYISNGLEKILFTVPISGISQNKLIKDHNFLDFNLWREKFLKQLSLYYGKSEYYKEGIEIINDSLTEISNCNIAVGIKKILEKISLSLEIKTSFTYSSELKYEKHLSGEDKILEICKQVGCTQYFNPLGGVEIYSKDNFSKSNLELFFLKTKVIPNQGVEGHLSIVDLIMKTGVRGAKSQLMNFEFF